MKRTLCFVHALSPLHAGTGQSVDVIDLPIARERSTNLPYVPGSSIKGVLRAASEAILGNAADLLFSIFGPETDNASDHAGSTVFGDARLLLFPVRSVERLFAWVTSPYLLTRFKRDLVDAGRAKDAACVDQALALVPGDVNRAFVAEQGLLVSDRVFLDDVDLTVEVKEPLRKLADDVLAPVLLPPGQQGMLRERLVLVSDTLMGVFVKQATEVVARICIEDDTKTVKQGGLWYEEALPTETLLVAVVASEDSRRKDPKSKAADHLKELAKFTSVQLGGKASVGRGLCRLVWAGEGAK